MLTPCTHSTWSWFLSSVRHATLTTVVTIGCGGMFLMRTTPTGMIQFAVGVPKDMSECSKIEIRPRSFELAARATDLWTRAGDGACRSRSTLGKRRALRESGRCAAATTSSAKGRHAKLTHYDVRSRM